MMICLLSACASVTPPPPSPTPKSAAPAAADESAERWKDRPVNDACRAMLLSLARGELETFTGVGTCGRVDAERAFGSSGEQPSRFEQFGEYRVYSFGGNSILVWFLSDDIRVVQLLYPKLPRPLPSLLGPPQAKTASQLSGEWEQWVYSNRGLTAHVKRATGEVVTLFAFRPTTVAAFLESDIARVSKSEAPLEDLK